MDGIFYRVQNMDPDENETGNSRRPQLPPLQTPYSQMSFAQTPSEQSNAHPSHQNQQQYRQESYFTPTQRSPHSHSTLPAKNALQLHQLCPADINVVPSTSIPCHDAQFNPSIQSSSSTIGGPMSITISPAPSYANVSPSSSRKQRFTMGPRADCEKCRLGVKGHWMHLD